MSHSAEVRLWLVSAEVRLWLVLLSDDRCIRLGSIGPDGCTLHHTSLHERCEPQDAVILWTIDGTPLTRAVRLSNGITGERVDVSQQPRRVDQFSHFSEESTS